jgi:hypothetical protein
MEQIVTKYHRTGFFFQTIHHGKIDKLGLASELEQFANDQWVGAHYSEEDAVATVMERFRKMVDQELQLIELRASVEKPDA